LTKKKVSERERAARTAQALSQLPPAAAERAVENMERNMQGQKTVGGLSRNSPPAVGPQEQQVSRLARGPDSPDKDARTGESESNGSSSSSSSKASEGPSAAALPGPVGQGNVINLHVPRGTDVDSLLAALQTGRLELPASSQQLPKSAAVNSNSPVSSEATSFKKVPAAESSTISSAAAAADKPVDPPEFENIDVDPEAQRALAEVAMLKKIRDAKVDTLNQILLSSSRRSSS